MGFRLEVENGWEYEDWGVVLWGFEKTHACAWVFVSGGDGWLEGGPDAGNGVRGCGGG